MNLVYDIELKNGMMLKGCYFIRYEKAVYATGNNNKVILAYVPSHMSCFIGKREIKDVDFKDAQIIKIYDEETNVDYTEKMIDNLNKVNNMLGYIPEFPISRQIVTID